MTTSRRAFLRGAGACVALPALASWVRGQEAAKPPLRLGFIGIANGTNYERWLPKGEGADYALNETFAPMAALRPRFQIVTNLCHDAANNWGDGPGDHARAGASFLTGCHAWKTLGSRLHLGISVDQIAAKRLGRFTRIDSLQLGVEGTRLYGSCDTGYPCAYQYNLSWASATLPLSPEPDPRAVFERLFGAGGPDRQALLQERLERRRSVLDVVLDDARRMDRALGAADRRKLGEYLDGVRALERQIEQAERFKLPESGLERPSGIPADHAEHVDLIYELMALAFQTDSTRVVSYAVAPEGSNRPFPELGIAEGYHFLTHHAGNAGKIAKVARIERWYMERLAKFLARLEGMKEADGTSVLHHSMILYGGAIGDGNRHNHDALPCVLAGGGGGALRPGRHVLLKEPVPMTNLFVAMLRRAGVEVDRVGDSTGELDAV